MKSNPSYSLLQSPMGKLFFVLRHGTSLFLLWGFAMASGCLDKHFKIPAVSKAQSGMVHFSCISDPGNGYAAGVFMKNMDTRKAFLGLSLFALGAYLFIRLRSWRFVPFLMALLLLPVVCHAWKPRQSVYNGARSATGCAAPDQYSQSFNGLGWYWDPCGWFFYFGATNSPGGGTFDSSSRHIWWNVVVVWPFFCGYNYR